MPRYAADTAVSTERSRMEIEVTLRRYKADQFGYATSPKGATVMFVLSGRHIRFNLPLPDRFSRDFTHTPSRGNLRSDEQREAAWEQACRQRWRALALVIKAKLEAVDTGITTVEDEFLAHTVLPDGLTVGEWAKPQIDRAYAIGQMPDHLLIQGPK
jgi:hypothetical protein